MLLVCSLLLLSKSLYATENRQLAEEVANLFLSIKVVLAEAQPLINNPDIGDKGLTADKVIDAAKANYKKITGKDFEFSADSLLKEHQQNLFKATKNVMNEAQPLINMQGVGFKGFITAVFAKTLAQEFSKISTQVDFKFTAPVDRLRSSENKPDSWESSTFENKFKLSDWTKGAVFDETVGNSYRWMVPLYHEEGCLSCHGGPKGERDITGFVKEGAKVGDLAGAFSVTLKQ